jgi:type IV pilus assembly protein PilW
MLRPAVAERRGQRGLSIVETMVGVAVGLFVVAAAAMLVSSQLSSNRRLLLDTQLQQDLRSSAEVIGRELRRTGALREDFARTTVWYPGAPAPAINPAAQTLAPSAGTANEASYQYQRDPGVGTYGFRLTGSKIQSLIGGAWQDLTDDKVIKVTTFDITVRNHAALTLPCPNDCTGGGSACWPTVMVREFDIDIEAEAANDATIRRGIRSSVRLRNDWVRRDVTVTSGICP